MLGFRFPYLKKYEAVEEFKLFFDIQAVTNNLVILKDNSMHAVLDIDPINFYELKPEQKQDIAKRFLFILNNLNCPIKIIVRTVNEDLQEKLDVLDSRVTYSAHRERDQSKLREWKKFITWFKFFVKKYNPEKKCYLVVPYNVEFKRREIKQQYTKGLKILERRVEFVKNIFKGFNIKRLSNYELINLYNSYLMDYIYTEQGYLTPITWLRLYLLAHKQKKPQEIKPVSLQDIDKKINYIKRLIKKRESIYMAEIDAVFTELTPKEKNIILKALDEDRNIEVTKETIDYIKENPITEHILYKPLIRTQKIDHKKDYLRIGNTFVKGLTAVGYPSYIHREFLKQILTEKRNIDTTISIEPSSIAVILDYLYSSLKKIEDKLFEYSEKGEQKEEKAVELKKEEKILRKHIKDIESGEKNLFKLALLFTAEGKNLDDVSLTSARITSLMRASDIILKSTTNNQKELIKSVVPTCANFLDVMKKDVTDDLLSLNFPFVKRR